MFWKKKPKIELFVRHCNFSEVSQHKNRIEGFSRQKCFENLVATLDPKRVKATFLLDTFHPTENKHFLLQQTDFSVIEIHEGTETGSFLRLLDHVTSLNLDPETIVYFLEDDYLHREGWVDILLEGFSIPEASYVTLYDHRDKYFLPLYKDLTSKIFHTSSCHWRTTPSTTNTYAMKYRTLLQHLPVHRQFSLGRKISADHEKFLELGRQGATLISPIPGWSTHIELNLTSPCIDWELLFQKKQPVVS
ncbi:MAG: hypothetical protein JSS10_02975 [Verrucomicrobia bacterium]|nr:hypothetical protein [Verrucomicrobiota bacterium]